MKKFVLQMLLVFVVSSAEWLAWLGLARGAELVALHWCDARNAGSVGGMVWGVFVVLVWQNRAPLAARALIRHFDARRTVLNLLSERPMYGLELLDRSRGTLRRGSMYVVLGRLEAAGVIEGFDTRTGARGFRRTDAGRHRRIYQITDAGRREIEA